jgi:hypothetical protein
LVPSLEDVMPLQTPRRCPRSTSLQSPRTSRCFQGQQRRRVWCRHSRT